MRLSCTKGVLLAILALVAFTAAACTQSKPQIPTPTLVPLAIETLILPEETPILPGGETPLAPAVETPQIVGAETPVPPIAETPEIATPIVVEPTLLPTPTIIGQEAPVATAEPTTEEETTAGGCPSPYTVQRGEWLAAIARKCGVSLQALIAANPGINPSLLRPGQQLRIPGGAPPQPQPQPQPGACGETYVIQRGDTLYSIAQKCGTTVAALMQANNIPVPEYIFPGQVLRIP